jgi:hypothetical protein
MGIKKYECLETEVFVSIAAPATVFREDAATEEMIAAGAEERVAAAVPVVLEITVVPEAPAWEGVVVTCAGADWLLSQIKSLLVSM